ncbi:MAG: sulfurtransferase-like selenium metabolism protein YedF [Deltaproteobacteria bacterium]|nr:MAG: sulfurtransferase-like selenium metabolism protein YedF [Deltaproteobacteria bacterium]
MKKEIVREKAVEGNVSCGPGTVIFINTDRIGQGEEELGKVLMKSFSFALTESKAKPQALVLMNNGVKLVAEGSEVLENLGKLESTGVKIMACGTCLDYYGLSDKVKVGSVSNMYDITETFLGADKVVTL